MCTAVDLAINKIYSQRTCGQAVWLRRKSKPHTVLMTGTSSGTGRAAAHFFADKNCNRAATDNADHTRYAMGKNAEQAIALRDQVGEIQIIEGVTSRFSL